MITRKITNTRLHIKNTKTTKLVGMRTIVAHSVQIIVGIACSVRISGIGVQGSGCVWHIRGGNRTTAVVLQIHSISTHIGTAIGVCAVAVVANLHGNVRGGLGSVHRSQRNLDSVVLCCEGLVGSLRVHARVGREKATCGLSHAG